MFKFLQRIFSIKRIKKQVAASNVRPYENRRVVAQRLFYVTLAIFILIILRLTWLVTANKVNGVSLSQAARNNYTYTYTVYPKRGTIYDRMGNEIAVDSSVFTIYVTMDKNYVDSSGNKLYASSSEFPALEDLLLKELNVPKDISDAQLNRKGAVQVYFGTAGNNISFDKKTEIEKAAKAAGIKGVGFDTNLSRQYQNGIFASQFIGTAALKDFGNSSSGLVGNNGGVEQAMNSVLQGQPSTRTLEKDPYGRPIPGAIVSQTKSEDGSDVYLTLDSDLQTSLENLLNTYATSADAQQISAVLMEAKTGDILATSQRPTYNPNDMSGMNQQYFTSNNLLYQLAYEPGSTMKTFLAASAMDTGNWHPDVTYDRSLQVADATINDWDVNEYGSYYFGHPTMTYAQGFAWSSNTGMGKVELAEGYGVWGNYLQRFGFSTRTRMGIGSEAVGTLPNDTVSQTMSAFGQGIGVTMLQMMKGWTSFANGGVMLEPHFVNKIVNPNTNQVLQSSKEVIGKPISATTAKSIASLMVTVGSDSTYGTANYWAYKGKGTDSIFKINGQIPAIKTGTAQIADLQNGGYMQGTKDTLNSAVILYPADNPEFIFYITTKIPQHYSLPDVATVADTLITQAETMKSQLDNTGLSIENAKVTLADYTGKATGDTQDILRRQLIQPVPIGDGETIVAQSIASKTQVGANTKFLLLTNGKHTMPDMYGWSKAMVEQVAKWYNVTVTFTGQTGEKGKSNTIGQVTKQSVSQLTEVKNGDKWTVTLGDS
ncbi:MAG: penicillin-binding protein [Streptococcaceae bacterium]|jgi:penicillin-binding protein 2X|nr:penicillin-binding protein [Streptococcaceae bacterium]